MRVTILALGSRGDVQPFIALGLGIRDAGHAVCIVAADDYAPLVRSYGLAWRSAGGSIDALMDREAAYAALDGARNPVRLGWRFLREIDPLIERVVRACADAAREADLLLASTLGVFVAAHLAEAFNIRFVPCHMHPYGPTRTIASVFFPTLPDWVPLRGHYNRLSHALTEQSYWQVLRPATNHARRSVLHLPPRSVLTIGATGRTRRGLTLYAYSPHVLPRPDDWPDDHHVTGYWTLPRPRDWSPPPDLDAFLAAGPPPIFIGFGSMLAGRDPAAWTSAVIDAMNSTGQRAVIQSAWNDWGQGPLPPTIYRSADVPHEWLFGRVAAVVTHGGAGTTSAALRAGVPMVVVPFLGDQHTWATRLHGMGVAAAPLPRKHLTAERLAASINEACAPERRQAAQAYAPLLRDERGVERALSLLRL